MPAHAAPAPPPAVPPAPIPAPVSAHAAAAPWEMWGHTADFYIAAGTALLALATVILILIGFFQIRAIRKQNQRWHTLSVCERYTTDPILDGSLKSLRKLHNEGTFDAECKKHTTEIITVLNYLDGIAIGIYQGLYLDELARDHLVGSGVATAMAASSSSPIDQA
jgi:hypothetical protein